MSLPLTMQLRAAISPFDNVNTFQPSNLMNLAYDFSKELDKTTDPITATILKSQVMLAKTLDQQLKVTKTEVLEQVAKVQ